MHHRSIIIVASIFVTCVCIGAITVFFYAFNLAWSDNTIRQTIEDHNEWPEPFSRVYDRIVAANPDVIIECYLLKGRPGKFSIEDALFRVTSATPPVIEALHDELDLVLTDTDLHRNWRHRHGVTPPPVDWWAQPDSSTSEHFVCRHRLEGDEGDLYYVTIEPDKHLAYIDYYFNF